MKSAIVGVFIPSKLASTANQDRHHPEVVVKHLPAHHWMEGWREPQAVTHNDTCAPNSAEERRTPQMEGPSRQEAVSGNCLDRQLRPTRGGQLSRCPNDIDE